MPLFILALGAAALLLFVLWLATELLATPTTQERSSDVVGAYRVRPQLLNKSEQAFFYELHKQLPNGYYVFPNMRIADILTPVHGKGFYKRRNHILPKHIDFLVCDRYFKPVLAVEVNGSSHQREDRKERDELVKRIFADAQLPLEFVDVGTSFQEAIARIVKRCAS